MLFWCHSGTAAGIYRDCSLRILCFQDQGIGYNTDICTYTDQFQFIFFIKSVPVQPAKRGFIYVFTISCFQSGNDLPSIGTLNTMLYRQLLSLWCIQIILPVGISCKNDPVSAICILFNLSFNIRYDHLCIFISQ